MLPSMSMLARASGRPDDLVRAVAAAARAVDPDVHAEVEMLTAKFERKQDEAELTALAVSVLGLAALLLACVGIVGLVAYSVAQPTREIAIRIALGATGVRVIAAGLRQLSGPVAAGLVLGMAGTAGLSQILRRELYGVSRLDPVAYAAAVAVFVATSTLAALWPARRALRVDPLSALKTD